MVTIRDLLTLNLKQNLPMAMVIPMDTTPTIPLDIAMVAIIIRDLQNQNLLMAIAMDIMLHPTTGHLMATAMVDTTKPPRVSL